VCVCVCVCVCFVCVWAYVCILCACVILNPRHVIRIRPTAVINTVTPTYCSSATVKTCALSPSPTPSSALTLVPTSTNMSSSTTSASAPSPPRAPRVSRPSWITSLHPGPPIPHSPYLKAVCS